MTQETEKWAEHTPRWISLAIGLLAVVSLVALVMGFNASQQAKNVEQTLAAQIKTVKQTSQQDAEVLTKRLEKDEGASAQVQGELSVVTKRLRLTQGELKQAKEEAAQIREENAKQLAAMDTAVKGQLATKANTEEVKAVSGEVTGVRTDLDSTKKELQMARSELGTLIARNHGQIEQLRRLGERDYFEFTLEGKGKPQKVGNITIELRGTNPKKNQFTVAIYISDLRLEKRNRSVNEPIFFYPPDTKRPLELVVNQVAKDKVVGYLSVPKTASSS